MKEKVPNFFLVGAAKAGTTSLYHYLNQHPDIYMSPVKEPKYLTKSANMFPHNGPGDREVDSKVIKNWDNYLRLFASSDNEKIIGEASADNLYFYNTSIPLIKKISTNPKILIILRDPVERSFSAFKHMKRMNREKLAFENALEQESERKRNNYEFIWFYKELGFYYNQVKAFIDAFGESSTKVVLHKDLKFKYRNMFKEIFTFLEVNENFEPDISIQHNKSNLIKYSRIDKLLNDKNNVKRYLRPLFLNLVGAKRTKNLVNNVKEWNTKKLNPDTKKRLIRNYKDDILKLQDLINRDLSHWLK